MPADLDEAYGSAAEFEEIEIARGRGDVAGYKIGLTTPIMQQLCGVDEPCYGAIFASEVRHGRAELAAAIIAGSGSRPRSRCGSARICRRAAMRSGRRARSRAAWRRSRCSKICGTTTSGSARPRWSPAMCGMPVRARRAGRPTGAASIWRRSTARLTINGREIGQGKGGDVMGNPLNALAWLANKLAADGTPLRRGMVVMTGSMVPIQFPAAGDRALVEVERPRHRRIVAT